MRLWRRSFSSANVVALLSFTILTVTGFENLRKNQIRQQLSGLATECDHARQARSDHDSALETLQQRLTVRRSQLAE
jgi:hypothetical protein